MTGDHQNPEGRIGEDARIATDAPVDFVVGIFSAAVTAVTFIGVLWIVGGDLTLGTPAAPIVIPGFLVIAAVIYAVITSAAVILVARRFVAVTERVNQSEAEFRYALTRVRENGESIALLGGEKEERAGLRQGLGAVILQWRNLCHQHMRYTLVSNTHLLVAPMVTLVLCAPKYVAGDHDARRRHASDGGFRSGPVGVQLAARQLSTAGGLGGVGAPRRIAHGLDRPS